MTQPSSVRITFHRNSFIEITGKDRTFFVDPVFSHERRKRRVAGDVRPADYVLVTSTTPWFDDTLDVMDACEATLVATPQICRNVLHELDLDRKRLLDLEAWEKASEEGIRITALPMSGGAGMESAIDEGNAILQDVSGVFPEGLKRLPFMGLGFNLLESGMRTGRKGLESLGSAMPRVPAVDRAGDMLGVDLGRMSFGRPGLAYSFQFDGFPSILDMADGIHKGTPADDLEDIAETCKPDVLICMIDGMSVEPLVRAVRILKPRTLLLYRSRDPYAESARSPSLPANAFIDAIAEDSPDCEAILLRRGDVYVVDSLPAEPAAT